MRTLILLPLLLVTAGCSTLGVNYNVEEANYHIIKTDNDFEIRFYEPMLVVETTIDGKFDSAGNRAFRKLFNYISGENVSNSEIAMTAPVITDQAESTRGEKIEMTTPVLEEESEQGWRYMFVLPEEFTQENAPMPLNEEVKLTAEPARKVAILRYSGIMDREVLDEKIALLQRWIDENGFIAISQPRWASYNPPWTLPFLRRNEVMIAIS